MVTRAREQASGFLARLADLGADCLECPTIRVSPPADPGPLQAALGKLDQYDWIVFTSVNGVSFFFERLFADRQDVRALHRMRIAAIGPATAARLRTYGLVTDIIPKTYRAESVIEAFSAEELSGKRILVPRAQEARPILPQELRRMGADVDEVAAPVDVRGHPRIPPRHAASEVHA